MRIILINFSNMQQTGDTKAVDTVLGEVFRATYALYFKTHSYHWNVRSPDFHSAHKMLQEQYDSLWDSLDEIAERFRAFDLAAPTDAPSVSALPFGSGKDAMFRDLLTDHESTIALLRTSIASLSEAGDEAGADFLTGRLAEHEKMAWMLRASIA